ncbi:hypothetical protein KIN20_014400 [Parelaphostrongylus tenuis]|uniref:Uncharacterized protein n=1 Tax=Parelaphostrongylus tenuis TaxID=148309 RepID=A0AAD5MW16_PARTN|nr:hypothetical protein KIN20_014400 [Parelaphostrongylus tenuis]
MGDARTSMAEWQSSKFANLDDLTKPRREGQKHLQRFKASAQQAYAYTPFKTSSMSRATTPLTPKIFDSAHESEKFGGYRYEEAHFSLHDSNMKMTVHRAIDSYNVIEQQRHDMREQKNLC